MAEVPLSLGEKTFILHGVDADFRNDGRKRYEYRSFEIETNLMQQTNGSSRLRIGNTDILVGVKIEIDTPYIDRPHEGKLEFFVDCSANATPEFEGKGGDDLANEISNILSLSYYNPAVFNLRKLNILPYRKCWKMFVDILILQCGGNLFDAVGIAVKAALYSTEIPKVTATSFDGGEADIQISDDPFDCIKLDITNYPLIVTLCKIGENCVIDPTSEEEMCSPASTIISIVPNGNITSIVKIGYGSMQDTTLIKMLEVGKTVALALNDALINALKKETELGSTKPIVGFLR
ncbi:hypothetical protein HZH68_008910 [Vespula germanica]|uniref:Ribosomal RNA-processing protein 42 n=1 Tax=Vespula germanica TaxID=30212 RepID=A0A834JZU6_VESGE|nr:hypothetical protein HZH68_008910 [Vespula germanica]